MTIAIHIGHAIVRAGDPSTGIKLEVLEDGSVALVLFGEGVRATALIPPLEGTGVGVGIIEASAAGRGIAAQRAKNVNECGAPRILNGNGRPE